MGDYIRNTRECTPDSMHPGLLAAIRAYIHNHIPGDGDILQTALICCETVSTRQKKGLFAGKAEVILTAVVLTPRWLIWAAEKENKSLGVLGARLDSIQVQDYEKSDLYKLVADSGLSIDGLQTDTTDPGSAFIGLGSEPAALKFRAMLKETVAKA